MVIQRKSSIWERSGQGQGQERSKEVKREVKTHYAKTIRPNLMKFGGEIHNGDTKKEFDFGSDRVNVKVKRGQKRDLSKTHYTKTI